MAQNLSERDLSAWLHSKLEEPWSSSKLAPLITKDIMKLIVDRFSLLDPAIKIRVMLAFLTMRKVMIKDMEADLLEIYNMGKEDSDEWVRVVASLLCTFPTQNMISYTDIHDNENFKKVFQDINSKLDSKTPSFYPLEYAYLNQSLFPKDLLQSVSANPHFTIKKPTPRLPPPTKKPVPIRKSIDMGARPTSPEPANQPRATSPLLPRPISPSPTTNKADIASKLFINRSKSRLTGSSNAQKPGLHNSGGISSTGANPKLGLRESVTRLGTQPQKKTQMIGLEEIEMKQQQQEEERRLKQQQIEDEKRAKQLQIEEEKRAKQAKLAAEKEAAEEAKKRKRAEKEKERAEGKKPRRKKQKLDNEEGEITGEQNTVEGEMSQSAQVNTSVTTASSSTVMVAHVVQRTNGANDDFDYDAPMSDAKMSHGDEAARPMFGAPISSLVTGAPAGNTMSSLSLAERLTQSLGTFGQTMTQRTQQQGQRMPSVVPIPPIAMPMMRPGVNTDSASQMLSQVLNPMYSTQMHPTQMHAPHTPHSLQNILAGHPTPIPIPGESRNMVLPPMHMPPQPFQVPGQPPQYSINDLPEHLQPQIQQLFAESPKLTEVDRYTIVKFLSQKEATGDKGPTAIRTFLCNETIVGAQLEQFVFEINYGTGTWRKLKRKRTLQQTPSM